MACNISHPAVNMILLRLTGVASFPILTFRRRRSSVSERLERATNSVIFSIVVDAAPYQAVNFVLVTCSRTVNTGKGMHHAA